MKKILFILFIVVCVIQLAVPAKMAWDKENIMQVGHEYKFRTAPIDPYDPFRGKYITLAFDANQYKTKGDTSWKRGDDVYVYLGTDQKGFAVIQDIAKMEPVGENINVDYVKAKITYVFRNEITIEYSFNRFYMDENKAANAEIKYREVSRDTSQVAYALVSVKNGDAALKDVKINEVSISEIAAQK